jgi:hypothetical protein
MPSRNAFLALPLVILAGGCWQTNDYAFPTSDDVRMGSSSSQMRDGASGEYGDVYALGMQTAHEVNGWVGEGVDAAGRIIEVLEVLPATSEDGEYDVYGPYYDIETDLSWMIRIAGDESESHFEVLVGRGKEATDELLDGEMKVDGDMRTGVFAMNFDTVETYDLKSGPDKDRSYKGSMEIRFERDTSSEHHLVEVVYDGFEVTQEFPIKEYFSADEYMFRRNADGAGEFVFSLVSTFQTQVWSGPDRERMTLELKWNADGAGIGKETISALDDGEGDLAYGDLVLEECFDEGGFFTWRQLSAEYAAVIPGYGQGDEGKCVDVDAKLPVFAAR